jgi:ribonuclease HI
MAILQAMLRIHPSHNLTVHSDNQGCVDKMARIETNDPSQWPNRVIWLRIHSLTRYRTLMGANTTTRWIHSHVDDPERRATPKAVHLCVCKSKREEECDPSHWAHQGNDRADELARQGADMGRTEEWAHRAQGELQYVIRKGPLVAHGPYSDWLKAHRDPKHPQPQPWKEACASSDPLLRQAMIKTLDTPGATTWRFWARMVAGILPTMSRMAKIVNSSNPGSRYREVYQDLLGPQGARIVPNCTHPKETTKHAITECLTAKQFWQRLSYSTEKQWAAEQNSSTSPQWAGIDWIANPPPNWNPEWTAWGLVPIEIAKARSNPAGIAELKKVAATAMRCAWDIWDSRIDNLKDWEKTNPGLPERKAQAGRAHWRPSNPPPT